MARYVALLRGINLGRARRVAMADLRDLLGTLGYSNVRTVLNSGNAVFDAPSRARGGHARRIEQALATGLRLRAHVVVKAADEFAAIVGSNPLGGVATDPSRLLVAFTDDRASLADLADLAKTDWSPGALALGEHAAYIWCPDGILESRAVQAVGRVLGGRGTTRNWATVERLDALLGRAT